MTDTVNPTTVSRSCRAFSLVEVVVALGVFSVAVLSSVALLGRSAAMRSEVVVDTHAPLIVDALSGELALVMRRNTASDSAADRRMTKDALPLQVPELLTAAGEPLVVLFSSEGEALGVVGEAAWMDGSDIVGGAILARCEGVVDPADPLMIRAEIILSSPAVAPLKYRAVKTYPVVLTMDERR